MKKLFLISLLIWQSEAVLSQTYTQSHKETEYNFGIVADADYATLSEIEKIKYELRQVERSFSKSINSSSQTTYEVIINHDDYEQSWMNPAKRFVYTPSGITLYDKNDSLVQTLSYSQEETDDNQAIANDIAANGFHPGLVVFPTHSAQLEQALQSTGIYVHTSGDTAMTLTYDDGMVETYNSARLTITRLWTDDDGIQNTETSGYISYGEDNGYLLQMRKRERFVQSVNGPCVTEVKFTYYKDYEINDALGLIAQAMSNANPPPVYDMTLFPNPNSGIFSVTVEIPQNDVIIQTTVTNLLTQNSFNVNANNDTSFQVNMQDKPDGNYVIQVFTGQTVISEQVIKEGSLPPPY